MDKSYIINEIKRTAVNNGGKPLGRIRFYKETGIKESDWYGKHWSKWSDAITEAGFSPNTLQQPLDADFLLQKFVELIIEIDNYPVKGDLLMKARNDPTFPSHNTFQRFGEKPDLAIAVIEYCKRQGCDPKVIDICKPVTKIKKRAKARDVVADGSAIPNKEIGYVYLIQFGNEYKIGTSGNVEQRFRQLRTQMPYEGKIIHTISTGDPNGIEAYWHNFFRSKRLKGEWFDLSASDISYFKKRTMM